MFNLVVKAAISGALIAVVSVIANRSPRLGAILLTLPLTSILAFGMTWFTNHDLKIVSQLSREMLILVPLGLPFFVPMAFAEQLGLGFWAALIWGACLAAATIGGWFLLAP